MAWFERSGMLSLGDWQRALRAIDQQLENFPRIVDFGCGCGRVLRHLRGAIRPEQELIGLDVDGEAIAWVNANLPGVTAQVIAELPPTSIADGTIDLVVNHSVFTHLPEDVGEAWLVELKRILRPGGVAILSFHGRHIYPQFRESLRAGGLDEGTLQGHDARFHRDGFFYGPHRNGYESGLPDYYGTTIHTIEYIDVHWQRHFELLAWLPKGSLRHQDIVVLRKN